ncbi:MAG TPA: LamG-like jellyroll fold domain-containing protein, partial [Catenuloplanes sp.]
MIPERRQAAGWVLLAAIVAFLANVLRLRAARTKGPQGTRPDADHGRVPHDASASGDLPAPRPPATDDVSTADNLSATADVSAVDHLATTGDQSVPHSLSATEEVSAVDTVSTTGDPSATDDLSTTNDGSAPGDVSAGADVPVELDRQVSELDPDGLDPAVLDPDGAHPIAAGRDARPVESGADLADLRARLFGTAGPPGPQDAVTERHQATDGRQAVGSGSVVGGRGWWRTSRRRLAILLLAFAVAAATAATAWAYWGGITTPGGNGAANAASVNQAPTPTAVVGVAQAVAVSWPAGTMTNTQAVSGYVVKRYDAATSVVQTTGTGCAGTITALTCTEAGVPMGNWKYSVTPLIGTNWQGAESLKSAQVGVGASVLTLARTDFGAPLPATTTGTLTGFGANEGLTYRLDAGTALTGSPATTGAGGAATITALTIPAGTSEGDHTVYAVGAGGSLASFSITVDLTAPTAAAALSPAANGAGWNNTSPVSVTLTGADGAGSGINQIRYTVDGSDPVSSGTVVVYSAPIPVAATATVRYYATDDAGNSSAVQNKNVNIDTVAPVNALTLSNVTGNAVKSGNTIYYRGAATGSFTVTNTLTDSGGSGAASSGTATLSGTSTGFTHTSSTVTTPTGGPYVSATFSWTAGATTSPTETVTGTDTAGNTVTTQLTLVNDSTGPGGVTVDATGLLGTGSRYSTSTTLSIATTKDGTAVTGAQLSRATATLTSPGTTNGVCGTFSGYTLITGGTDPASPKADTVTDQACYRYQYVVSDNVGNTTTQTSGDIKVDTTAPSAPTLAFSALTNAYPVGMTVYYRSAATGSFTTTALGADLASGIASYAFPTLGTGWTSTPGATGVNTYSWTASPTAPGAKNITATGNNTLTSTATAFTPTVDGSAPTGGSASHVNGYTTGLAVTVTFTGATADTGSGINPTSGRLKRTSTPLVNDVCVGATTTVNVENPTSPYTDSTVTSGNCYDYQYIMSDNVGNTAFWHSGSVAKVGYAGAVAADASLLSYWRLGESSGTVMADSKGTNTGSYANGPALGTAGAITGDTNTAVTYDGTDDYSQALATTGIPIGAAPRSVEMWFKTTSVARQTLFEYGSFGDTQEFGLYLRANNNDIVAWGFGGAGKDITFPLATPVTDGAWHHVVNTYDGTTLAVYIDGVLLGAEATVRNTVMDVDGSFGIGAALPLTGNGNSGGYFNGSLDEVSLYSTVLGAQKIADHFNLARSTDALGPAGGAVDAVGLVGTGSRYSTSTSLSIGFSKGADSAGVAATGATLTRATATLSSAGTANATCGTFGSYATLTGGTDPSSPFADTVTAQACYRYRYMVTDTRGNATTYTSGDIKVDTTASSTPTLAFSGFSNTFWSGSGSTVFYRSGASTGAFTATASSVDSNSGIASYAFPSLGTNWTS